MLRITLPWPPRELHPNARVIWQVKHKFVVDFRHLAAYTVITAQSMITGHKGQFEVRYTFHPPNKAARDLDNLVANMKAGLDGIMDGLQCNDNQVTRIVAEWGEHVPGGAVTVEIVPLVRAK